MKPLVAILAVSWAGFWFTPDQQGRRLFYRGEYAEAAKAFHDPMWQGIAWFRAADFKQAAAAFSRRETPEAFFNQGNALVMAGQYDAAIAAYSKALEKRPNWKDAEENRELAKARAKLTREETSAISAKAPTRSFLIRTRRIHRVRKPRSPGIRR